MVKLSRDCREVVVAQKQGERGCERLIFGRSTGDWVKILSDMVA